MEEFRGLRAVRVDPPHLCRRDYRDVGLLGGEERLDGKRAAEVERAAVSQDKLKAGLLPEPADERGAHHAAVACDEELCHGLGSFSIWASRLARSRSCSTMIFTSSLNRTFGLQPSCLEALAGSPIRSSTSAGRS